MSSLIVIDKEVTQKAETEENDPKLLKFLTNSSESTSEHNNNNANPNSLVPILSVVPEGKAEK
jgi:hypothetical protein